jgi:hypothetical protein
LLITRLALAQAPADATPQPPPPFTVEVERDELAIGCPDLSWFQARIASHIGKAGHSGTFKITLGKQTEVWQAKIERRESSSSPSVQERVLQDRSPTCEPLAEAVTVTVAILADDAAEKAQPPPARPSDTPPIPTVPDTQKVESSGGKTFSKVWVGASGGTAVSFISPIAPIFGLGGALDYANLRAGVRLMMTPEQKFALDPGRVFVQAWLTTLYGCLQGTQGQFGAAVCVAADASLLRARAEGFDQGKPGTRGYEAAGLEVHPSWYASEGFRISAVLGALLPFSRESFSVTGRGVAYVPPRANLRVLLLSEVGVF